MMNDLLQLSSLSTAKIQHILDVAELCRQGQFVDSEKGKLVANLFLNRLPERSTASIRRKKSWA